jgi:hypothetical protein
MAEGEEPLAKVKVADAPGASAVPVALTHLIELPLRLLPQPSEFPALDGSDGKLLPPWVQPYQKLFSAREPVFRSVIV